MTTKYEITIFSIDGQDLLYRAHGTRHDDCMPYILLDQLGQKYGECKVVFNNLSEGWQAEKVYR